MNTQSDTSQTATLPVPEVRDVDVAFGANALDWMPPMAEIPAEFKRWRGNVWGEITAQWFFSGLPATTEFIPKDGVDPAKALRVIKATLGSFAPKHEHKEAAVAYMLSCWFERIEGWKEDR